MFSISPYLNYDGNCEEAFNLYKKVFGGEFSRLERFKNMSTEKPLPDAVKEKILHISLPISKEVTLMGSDCMEGMGPAITKGNNYSLFINAKSKEEVIRIFKGLSDGAVIVMPLGDTFWGAYF